MTSIKKSLFKRVSCVSVMLVMMLSFAISAQAASSSTYIGESKAKSIALNHAVLTEQEVMFDKLTMYSKNGVRLYDIEFLSATTKYSYEINAQSGDIIAYYLKDLHNSSSIKSSGSNNQDNKAVVTSQYIGNEKAKEIALNHAGASATNVKKYEIELDEHGHRMIYEIEFVSGGMEYEYEIDAITGDILFWESERD